MTTFTITIPDADLASVTAEVATVPANAPAGSRPAYPTAGAWVSANVLSLVKQCVDSQKAKRARDAGIEAIGDLTDAEIATIKASRAAARVNP